MLGVGYIIGPRIGSIMCAGGVLAYLVLIPAIKFFGESSAAIIAPGTIPISQMTPDDIREAYVLYIGAGAVAAGGIISMVRSLPLIWHGMKSGLADLRSMHGPAGRTPRTDQDLSMKFVIGGVIALLLMIMIAPQLHLQWNLLGALLIVVIGFLFTTVSSHLTGEIGSSSCPTSGMTVATLLLTCLVFLIVGWTGPAYFVTALSIGGIVCIASSNGGTTSQDLKTGFLVGSTPRSQQIAILAGSLASALALGPILLVLNDAYTVYVPATTFQKIEASATPPRVQIANLSPFQEKIKPDTTGNYRVLKNEKGGANSIVPGLEAGEYLVNEQGEVVYKVEHNFPLDLRPPSAGELGPTEHLKGAQANTDPQAYRSWQRADPNGGPAQHFLVNDRGEPIYLVDPGINGTHHTRPDGSAVTKFDAPKATLMSYIIKGILGHKLPWALVLLGVMIADHARDERDSVARVCRRCVSPAGFFDSDFCWRDDSLAGRSLAPQTQVPRSRSHRTMNWWRRATRVRGFCSPPVTLRAARSPASSSPSWRAGRAWARSMSASPRGRRPTILFSPARTLICLRWFRLRFFAFCFTSSDATSCWRRAKGKPNEGGCRRLPLGGAGLRTECKGIQSRSNPISALRRAKASTASGEAAR